MVYSAGRYTCSGSLPGSLGQEQTDVETLLDWEVGMSVISVVPTSTKVCLAG